MELIHTLKAYGVVGHSSTTTADKDMNAKEKWQAIIYKQKEVEEASKPPKVYLTYMHASSVTICPYKFTKAISMSFRYEWLNDLKIKRNELVVCYFPCLLH